MTIVNVNAGSCGFTARIEVSKTGARTVSVSISSDCEAVEKWGDKLRLVNWRDCLGKNALSSPIFVFAADCLRHVTCPVPIGLLKAIEVEIGASLPADATIRFLPGK
ncbi:MAG: hypothetical protein B6I22_14010 [Desulfobacteraceae bacterium 4572_123]|nr:MAG: hypothetical protein B6I22_14010 [Desulfobacteraceae bacterium 4572_123]